MQESILNFDKSSTISIIKHINNEDDDSYSIMNLANNIQGVTDDTAGLT